MTPVLAKIEHITLMEALIYSLIGFTVVFVVLVVLMAVILALRTVMEKLERKTPDEPVDSGVPQNSVQSLVPAKGSVGEVSLFTVDDKTAAMLMAIVADKVDIPLNKLRFLYMREEGKCVSGNGFAGQAPDISCYRLLVGGRRYEVGIERCETIMVGTDEAVSVPVAVASPAAPVVSVPELSGAEIAGEPVRAPLPGVVLGIKVNEGDFVKAGQVLMVLEAMKMENEVVAPRDGKVTQIIVSKGSAVEIDAILLSLV